MGFTSSFLDRFVGNFNQVPMGPDLLLQIGIAVENLQRDSALFILVVKPSGRPFEPVFLLLEPDRTMIPYNVGEGGVLYTSL